MEEANGRCQTIVLGALAGKATFPLLHNVRKTVRQSLPRSECYRSALLPESAGRLSAGCKNVPRTSGFVDRSQAESSGLKRVGGESEFHMPFEGFQCQRCGECCRKLGSTLLSFTDGQLSAFEYAGVGSDLDLFRDDSRVERFDLAGTTTYEILSKQTALESVGSGVHLETEGEHCAFFTLDGDNQPACDMELTSERRLY